MLLFYLLISFVLGFICKNKIVTFYNWILSIVNKVKLFFKKGV
jgi:hypothetical protein